MMKPKTSKSNSKLTQYELFRNRAKSDLNTSGLLSGLTQLDQQMKEYQQKREMKNSSSELELPLGKNSTEKTITFKEKAMGKYSQAKTERVNNTTPLTPIVQYNPRGKQIKQPTMMSSSTVSMQTPKGKSQGPKKVLFSKPINAHSKQKDPKKEKIDALRAKAKELQQQML